MPVVEISHKDLSSKKEKTEITEMGEFDLNDFFTLLKTNYKKKYLVDHADFVEICYGNDSVDYNIKVYHKDE